MIINKTEADYQAEYDANTLARAEEIRADESRMKAAMPKIEEMLKEKQALTNALNKLIKKEGKK